MGQKRLLRGLRKKKKGRLSKRDSMNRDGDLKKKKTSWILTGRERRPVSLEKNVILRSRNNAREAE